MDLSRAEAPLSTWKECSRSNAPYQTTGLPPVQFIAIATSGRLCACSGLKPCAQIRGQNRTDSTGAGEQPITDTGDEIVRAIAQTLRNDR